MTTNRAILLARVRKALDIKGDDRARKQAVAERLRQHPRGTIPAQAAGNSEVLLQRLAAMLTSQGAAVVRAATAEAAVRAVAAELRANNIAPALRMGSDPVLAALPWVVESSLAPRSGRAEAADQAAVSRAVAAAAETGTLFLVSGADNPTTLGFLPELHVVVVRSADIVGAYEDAFDRLREAYGEGALPRSVNLVSGPSRTADIEQTIVRGAHGPKRLVVVILD